MKILSLMSTNAVNRSFDMSRPTISLPKLKGLSSDTFTPSFKGKFSFESFVSDDMKSALESKGIELEKYELELPKEPNLKGKTNRFAALDEIFTPEGIRGLDDNQVQCLASWLGAPLVKFDRGRDFGTIEYLKSALKDEAKIPNGEINEDFIRAAIEPQK